MKVLFILMITITVFAGTVSAQTNINTLGGKTTNQIMETYTSQQFNSKNVMSILTTSSEEDGTGKKYQALQIDTATGNMTWVPYTTKNKVKVYEGQPWLDMDAGVLLKADATTDQTASSSATQLSYIDQIKKEYKDRAEVLQAQKDYMVDSMKNLGVVLKEKKKLQKKYGAILPEQNQQGEYQQQSPEQIQTQTQNQQVLYVSPQGGGYVTDGGGQYYRVVQSGGYQAVDADGISYEVMPCKRPSRNINVPYGYRQASYQSGMTIGTIAGYTPAGKDPNIGPYQSGY